MERRKLYLAVSIPVIMVATLTLYLGYAVASPLNLVRIHMYVHAIRASDLSNINSPAEVAKIDGNSVVIDDSHLSQIPVLKTAFNKAILSSPKGITITGVAPPDSGDFVISPADSDGIMNLAGGKLFHDSNEQTKSYDTHGNVLANLGVDRSSMVFKYQGDYYFVIIQKVSII
jgi:hypothetical protein